MDLSAQFAQQVEPHLASLVDDVLDIARNKKLKVNLRLKAIDMLWARSIPTKKAVDHNLNQQVNIFYMSPQEVAAASLAGTATPLNDLAKVKRIEREDLPPALLPENEIHPNEDFQEI